MTGVLHWWVTYSFVASALLVRLQVAVVYLNAAASKWGEPEWTDGTALYYWFRDPAFGLTAPLQAIFGSLMHNGFLVSMMTWGVIAFEFALFGGLFTKDKLPRHILLGLGIAFHTGIMFVHGLPSFVLIMFGALILLFRREHEIFDWIWPKRATQGMKRMHVFARRRDIGTPELEAT